MADGERLEGMAQIMRRTGDTDMAPAEVFEFWKMMGPARNSTLLMSRLREEFPERTPPSKATLMRWRKAYGWDEKIAKFERDVSLVTERRDAAMEARERSASVVRLLAARKRALDIVEVMLGLAPERPIAGKVVKVLDLSSPSTLDLQRVTKFMEQATLQVKEMDRWNEAPDPDMDDFASKDEVQEELRRIVRYGKALQKLADGWDDKIKTIDAEAETVDDDGDPEGEL